MKERRVVISGAELPDGTPIHNGVLTDEGIKIVAPYLADLFKAALEEAGISAQGGGETQ